MEVDAMKNDKGKKATHDQVETLERKVFDLLSLIKAGRAMSNMLEPEQLFPVFLSIVREKLNADYLALFIFEEEGRIFNLAFQQGLKDPIESFPCEEGLMWQTILQNDPFMVVDSSSNPLFVQYFRENDLDSLQSQLWIPLITMGKVIGLLTVGKKEGKETMTSDEFEFLKQLSAQASVSINASRLYQQRKKEKEELDKTLNNLSLIYNVNRAMTFISDLKSLLLYILDQAIEITGAEKGSIMLFDAETNLLKVRVLAGLDDVDYQEKVNNAEIECQAFRPGEGVAGQVFETGKPLIVNKTRDDSSFVNAQNSFTNSIACIPMMVYKDVIGVINVTNKKDSDGFEEDDVELLKAVADQAAVGINKAQLWEMAVTDGLTSLFIRRYFLAKLTEELHRSSRYNNSFSLVMLDLDHFKSINDNYGHPAGDQVLKSVAKIIQQNVREVDLPARYGGEEFIILLAETDSDGAMLMAERLRRRIEEMRIDGIPPITGSLGIASFPDDAKDADTLIEKADTALYEAKETGRNKWVIFEEGMKVMKKKNIEASEEKEDGESD